MTDSPRSLREQIRNGQLDRWLAGLYGERFPRERERYIRLLALYEQHFAAVPRLFSAPGRTELAGNHTDHQRGRVLCASLGMDLIAAAAPNGTRLVRLVSEGYGEVCVDLTELRVQPGEAGSTAALIRGVAAGNQRRALPWGGFDAVLSSAVPSGGGFSSSAALEVLLGAVYGALYGDGIPDPLLSARIGQEAENEYFGKPCGLMDQCACALGGVSLLDFEDPAAPAVEKIDFDFRAHGYVLGAVNVGSSHEDLTEDYAAIPAEMRLVARAFGKDFLREVDEEAYRARRAALPASLPERAVLRADHFFAENARVTQMAAALRRGDGETYRRLMLASGRSSAALLQNIIPDSHPEETQLATGLAMSEDLLGDKGAWRVHGGGFGGSLQALVPASLWTDYRAAMDAVFGAGACRELIVRPVGAAVAPIL